VPTITIRADDDLFEQIENKREDQSKADFYRRILVNYLNSSMSSNNDLTEYIKKISELTTELTRLTTEIKHKEEIDKVKEERIHDLQRDLGWIQLEYQKLNDKIPLLNAASPEREYHWWQFWKSK